jgi:hypothetical protein
LIISHELALDQAPEAYENLRIVIAQINAQSLRPRLSPGRPSVLRIRGAGYWRTNSISRLAGLPCTPARSTEDGMAESAKAASVFLAQLGDSLANQEGVDADLAAILKTHLLTASPAKDAVPRAKAAIAKLTVERAAAPTEDAADG